MTFRNFDLKLNCQNSAFDDDPTVEVARILRDIADRMEEGVERGEAYDVNGNRVGSFGMIR
jgi:hypothetical protein